MICKETEGTYGFTLKYGRSLTLRGGSYDAVKKDVADIVHAVNSHGALSRMALLCYRYLIKDAAQSKENRNYLISHLEEVLKLTEEKE